MELITDSHEWVKREGNVVTVGITKRASSELGDIVYVELPKVGQKVLKGEEVVVLESTKAAVDSYAPIDGEVIAINQALSTYPELVNNDPEGAGWFYKLQVI